MPLPGINQPEIIIIGENLRLRKYDGKYIIALPWYQDPVVYHNSEGITDESEVPDEDYVRRMYDWLNKNGELYFIEIKENDFYIPIGDVTLKPENPPIAIGVTKYRGVGIGRRVMSALIDRAREINIPKFSKVQVFDYNITSQKMFEALGFICTGCEGRDKFYELTIINET